MKKIINLIIGFSLLIQSVLALPTQDFIAHHTLQPINQVLYQYGMTETDKNIFKQAILAENDSFIGYHAGCSSYMLFQDIIRMVVEEKLEIPVREGFHFLRVPGTSVLKYPTATDFITNFIKNYPGFMDDRPDTRIHILSLNISLYQSYSAPWDLTPRYFLENLPWTSPSFWLYLEDFFSAAGLDQREVIKIVNRMAAYYPQNRGFIMQFFDPSEEHSFLEAHFYAAHSGGLPIGSHITPFYLINNPLWNKQLRLVIDNQHILNPFGQMIIKRYDAMTDQQRTKYEGMLREAIRAVEVVDSSKTHNYRKRLLDNWSF